MSDTIRALDFRQPAPRWQCADGREVQTRYYDAAGWQVYEAWEREPTDAAAFLAAVQYVVPELDAGYIDSRLSLEDCQRLIAIGKGNADLVRLALGNGGSGGESPAPPLTPPSSPTT